MTGDTSSAGTQAEESPLISTRFLIVATVATVLLAAASFAISWYGQTYGERLALAGHSESQEVLDITVGRDRLSLTANTLRFEEQRQNGSAERVDLYLLWPEMVGYSSDQRRRFDDLTLNQSLIFLQISQSTMSRDMSGRVEPIYRHLLEAKNAPAPAGLTSHSFKASTGYDGESLLTGSLPNGESYAIRCVMPAQDVRPTSSDCQRDIHVGEDLTVLYRFPSTLLPHWQAIDAAVRSYVSDRARPATAPQTLKNQLNPSRGRSS